MSSRHNSAIIDEKWMGHHSTYFTHFSAAIAAAGANVVPFCADPDDFLKRFDQIVLLSAVRGRIAGPVSPAGPVPSCFCPTRWRRHGNQEVGCRAL
jgi:hypothetical protein